MISDYKIVQIISILLKKCKQTLKVKELLLVDDAKHQQVCKVLETTLNCSWFFRCDSISRFWVWEEGRKA